MNKKVKNYNVLITFFLSGFVMFLIYLFSITKFNENLAMRSDYLYGGIGYFIDFVRNTLHGQSNLFSFGFGLGLNEILAIASNGISIFNLLYFLYPVVSINTITIIIVVLKVACIGAAFQFYSSRILHNDDFSSIVISVFYSICAFALAYGTIHIMWLDALMILPILCYAISICIDSNKRVLLILLYTLLFVSYFYLGYIVGIFSFLYVVSYILLKSANAEKITGEIGENVKGRIKICFKQFANWILCAVIGVMLSAALWVPTLFFIMANRVEDSTQAYDISATLLQIINSLFWGMGYGIEGTYSYIYCGIPVLLLVPLFFFNKEINIKEKLFYGILTAFLFVCTICKPINLLLHAFDQPDSFWYRYSFLISFCLCSMAAIQLKYIKEVSIKTVLVVVSILVLLYQFIQQTTPIWSIAASYVPSQNNNTNFIFNCLFIAGWIIIGFLYCNKNEKIRLVSLILAGILVAVEGVTVMKPMIPVNIEKEGFDEWYDSMLSVTDEIKKNDQSGDLYRVLVRNNDYTQNADLLFGYNGVSDFGNIEKYKVRRFLCNIGFATSPRWSDDSGFTPVSEMLLGVKYVINRPSRLVDEDETSNVSNYINDEMKKIVSAETLSELDAGEQSGAGETTYEKNEYNLGIGYLVSGEALFFDYPGRNVFENSNAVVSVLSGLDLDCFDKIDESRIVYDEFSTENTTYDNGMGYIRRTDSNGAFYITVMNEDEAISDAYLQVEDSDPGNYGFDFYVRGAQNIGNLELVGAELSNANEMYYNKEKKKYTLFLNSVEGVSPEILYYDALNLYSLNEENLKKQYDELSKGMYKITKYSNGHIEGTVDVSGDKTLLFTSIPYDPGWTCKVNGTDTEVIRVIDGAFMAVYLPKGGECSVEFDYECPGLKIGIMVSLLGILALLSVMFEKQLKSFGKDKKKGGNN